VNGVVTGDVRSALGDIKINNHVGGDVHSGSGDIVVRAPVDGEVDAGFGDVYVYAPVAGGVDVERGDVVLVGPRAMVQESVYYGSGEFRGHREAVKGAVAAGMGPDMMDHEPDWFGITDLVGWVFGAAAFAACSVLLTVLAPGLLLAAARRAEESPGWSLFFGVTSVPASSCSP
jgi:hypothetical protein